jgi:hypothetical protein
VSTAVSTEFDFCWCLDDISDLNRLGCGAWSRVLYIPRTTTKRRTLNNVRGVIDRDGPGDVQEVGARVIT